MEVFQRGLGSLFWFVAEAGVLGGLDAIYVLAGAAFIGGMMIWRYPRQPISRKRLWWLLVLPIPWLITGMWGGWFWQDWRHNAPPFPRWVVSEQLAALVVEVVLIVGLVVALKGARVFAAAFATANLYLTLFCAFMAGMATSGTWL